MELSEIQSKIYEIRGQRVMLDFDLAEIYGVETRVLNQAARRNIYRFPVDFMFQLTKSEWENMLSQIVMTYPVKRPKTAIPLAFTELGVAMLSSVLTSKTAIQINMNIMRAFVAVRNYLLTQSEVSAEIKELWQHVKALEERSEENLRAINDLNEENQQSFDEIYVALSELAKRQKEVDKVMESLDYAYSGKKFTRDELNER